MQLNRKPQLIAILLDSSAREDERDDAAIELADFDGDDVVQSLFAVANDRTLQSEMIKGTCGESLASIWIRTGRIDFSLLSRLDGTAQTEALGLIIINRVDWYDVFVSLSSDE